MEKVQPKRIEETIVLPSGETQKIGIDYVGKKEGTATSTRELFRKLQQAAAKGVFPSIEEKEGVNKRK